MDNNAKNAQRGDTRDEAGAAHAWTPAPYTSARSYLQNFVVAIVDNLHHRAELHAQ
jgi:hypothetical protein